MSDEPGFDDITDNERNMHGSDDSVWLARYAMQDIAVTSINERVYHNI